MAFSVFWIALFCFCLLRLVFGLIILRFVPVAVATMCFLGFYFGLVLFSGACDLGFALGVRCVGFAGLFLFCSLGFGFGC